MKILEYTLPAHLASYLINGDASGYDDAEIAEIDNFLDKEQVSIIDIKEINEGSFFKWKNDLNALGADCYIYIATPIIHP